MPKWSWLRDLFSWTKSVNTQGASRVAAAAETPPETACNNTLQKKKKKPIVSVDQKGNIRVLKVVAICGSLRKASHNRGLIRTAIEIVEESIPGMEIELIDISNLPFLNTDLEVDGRFPDVVDSFRKKFLDADCILFSSPEYNYSVTGLMDKSKLDAHVELFIQIVPEKANKCLTIIDSRIGMTKAGFGAFVPCISVKGIATLATTSLLAWVFRNGNNNFAGLEEKEPEFYPASATLKELSAGSHAHGRFFGSSGSSCKLIF